MRNISLICFALLLYGTAFADDIYKWTDENGKVHYGDRINDPKNGTKIVIKVPEISTNKTSTSATENRNLPLSAGSPAKVEPKTEEKCLEMARIMMKKTDPTPDGIRADSKQLLDMCPGLAYQCFTYIERPEKNSCKTVPLKPGGHITDSYTYQR